MLWTRDAAVAHVWAKWTAKDRGLTGTKEGHSPVDLSLRPEISLP